jgi:hypothetical protein
VSANPLRDAFRAALSSLLVPDGFLYVESINQAESTRDLPNQWYTLDFLPATDSRISLGKPTLFRELGRCSVAIFTPQQTFDDAAVTAAEKVRQSMANWTDPTGMIRVESAQPATDMDGGDFRGAFYGITVDLMYAYDRFA